MASSAHVVYDFASSLDDEDYPLTRTCLTDQCVYDSPTGELIGPDAIIDSYKGHGDSARRKFDSIVYDHDITPLDDGWFQIEFVDELHSGEKSHVFRCHQRVCVDGGRIVHIAHEEIPGQREQLNAFLESLA